MMNDIFGPGFASLPERARLERTARELEAVVVSQLFTTMRKTVPEGGFLEQSPAEETFRSLLDGELARVVAQRSPFGLADAVTKQMAKLVPEDPESAPQPASRTIPRGRIG